MTDQLGLGMVTGTPSPPVKPVDKVVREPAIAAAIARCCMVQMDHAWRRIHVGTCIYCPISLKRKMAVLNEFNQWSGQYNDGSMNGPTLKPVLVTFMSLDPEEQRQLVDKAAGYTQEAPNGGRPQSKAASPGLPASPGWSVGERPGAGERDGGGIGGPEAPARAPRGRVSDPGEETSGPEPDNLAVPPVGRHIDLVTGEILNADGLPDDLPF